MVTAGPIPARVEALDELGLDPEDAPRVGIDELRPAAWRRLQELLILGRVRLADPILNVAAHDDPATAALGGHRLAAVTRRAGRLSRVSALRRGMGVPLLIVGPFVHARKDRTRRAPFVVQSGLVHRTHLAELGIRV